jgi:type IV pilus assembly protein PilQ
MAKLPLKKYILYFLSINVLKHLILLIALLFPFLLKAQEERLLIIEQKLQELSMATPGLNERVDFSISGGTIQEFLRGLAETNNLNVSIDPNLNFKIYNNFTNEKIINILLFLAREYSIDIKTVGSIMSFTRFNPPNDPIRYIPKEIKIEYNSYKNTLTLDLQKDSLELVVRKLTKTTKNNVVLSNGLSDRLVSVYIEDLPLDNALEKFAYVNDLKVVKGEDNVYLIQRKDQVGDMSSQGNSTTLGAAKNNKRDNQRQSDMGGIDSEVSISILDTLQNRYLNVHAFNVPIADIIQQVSEALGISYFTYSSLQGNANINFTHLTFDDFLTNILNSTEYTFRNDQGIYLIGDRKLEGLRSYRVFQFKFRSIDAILEIIPAELKTGVEIKEFKELNSILLSGALPQIKEIELFIKELDRVVPLVLIEVIIVDVRKGTSVTTGIRAGLSDSVKTQGTLLPGLDFTLSSKSINDFLNRLGGTAVNIGRVTPNFYVGLSALEENSNVEVRSMPKLSTLNGHEATLSIGSKRYYSIRTQNVLGSLNPSTVVTEQFQSVEANLGISIKPVVSGDDQVTLDIDVSISDFLEQSTPNAPPPTSTSQFKSIIRVRNEEMVVLGGLERTDKSESGRGVPLLSRIPVLKWLFSSKSKSRNKTVSVVFIKPTIIY